MALLKALLKALLTMVLLTMALLTMALLTMALLKALLAMALPAIALLANALFVIAGEERAARALIYSLLSTTDYEYRLLRVYGHRPLRRVHTYTCDLQEEERALWLIHILATYRRRSAHSGAS